MEVRKRNRLTDVNGATSTQQVESRTAGATVRQLRSSSSEVLTTEQLRIATWNVRTLRRAGKLENVKAEMARLKVNILGVCETRWPGEGDFFSDEYRVIHSGKEGGQSGVAVILDKRTARSVLEIRYEGDRILMVKLKGKPVDIIIIQVYMPTSDYDEEAVETMYEQIEELLDKETVGKDYTVIMGDWNAVVGEGKDENVVGHYGLGTRNERGEKLIEFCKRRQMYVNNTWFCQDRRRRYTWTSPGNTGRYQIDYIMTKQRYWNSVINAKSYPGADADSDHNPVVSTVRVKLKKVIKARSRQRWNIEKLKNNTITQQFEKQTNIKLEQVQGDQ